jgi:predicted RNase H-like HicB family nuclease
MMIEYINTAIENAEYKKLEDGTWFVEVPGYEGVWANGDNIEACRRELMEVLEEWLLLKIKDNEPIPTIKGIDINIRKVTS